MLYLHFWGLLIHYDFKSSRSTFKLGTKRQNQIQTGRCTRLKCAGENPGQPKKPSIKNCLSSYNKVNSNCVIH